MNSIGQAIRLQIFGESHGVAIGGIIDGLPPGMPVDVTRVQAALDRRRPGTSKLVSARNEADEIQILSGVFEGRATGAPLAFLIPNTDTRSKDYGNLATVPRPGHADYPDHVASLGFRDYRGGGHNSGRLTAILVAAGAIVDPILSSYAIQVGAHLSRVGSVAADSSDEAILELADAFPCADLAAAEAMKIEIEAARQSQDSVGAEIQFTTSQLPVGLGSPWFDGIESAAARLLFAIPAVKAVGFGAAWDAAEMRGAAHNDQFTTKSGKISKSTNFAGGALGGRTDGAALSGRVTIKPASSISQSQKSVDLESGEAVELKVLGRHDPCIGIRAVPVVKSAIQLVLADAIMVSRQTRNLGEFDWS